MWKDELISHQDVFKSLYSLEVEASEYVQLVTAALKNGKKLFFAGNGGSAADAQHIATEFVVRYVKNRKALPAIALTTDTSALTAIGNDLGFDFLFARQIEALGVAGDVLTVISTSGNSQNLTSCIEAARNKGMKVVALLGRDGGEIKPLVNLSIVVESNFTARIQEAHIFILHHLVENVEKVIFDNF